MTEAIQSDKLGLPDVETFLRLAQQSGFFQAGVPIVISRAPGRLDVMGGIADYSGALVLQLPIREATLVAVQREEAPLLRIVSREGRGSSPRAEFCLPLSDLPATYAAAQSYFAGDPNTSWAAYAIGALLVLMREKGVRVKGGLRMLIASDVPESKGVSSSAAFEVAVMQALARMLEVPLSARELALLCQKVENQVVGAPCGVMDQMTSAAGQADHLLALVCQPAEVQGNLPIPEDMAFFGIDSGVRHSISGADYGSVRVGAFMGYRIVADIAGLPIDREGDAVRIADSQWNGYLANIAPSYFAQHFAPHLPERMQGAEFLARYGGTTDTVTRIDPRRTYPVRVASAHPIYEHFRVRAFAQLLGSPGASRLALMGELMYQSHASYSLCGIGSEGTDRIVALVRAAGPERGLYGAKITGGGSGGTVAVLARRDAEAQVQEIAARYAEETDRPSYVFTSSSPGAAAWGTHILTLAS